MSFLRVPYLNGINQHTPLREMEIVLNDAPRQQLAYAPWAEYPYHPEVQFAIAHGNDAVFIKYFVKEKTVRAVHHTLNSPVYKDSCVEFFIGFNNEPAYYNFEFNCIGAHLIGYGEDNQNRQFLPSHISPLIKYKAALINDENQQTIGWELTLMIPVAAFYFHTIQTLQGLQCAANFYKCGDELPEPHFVTWANIQWPQPNFHVRRFFGALEFE